jgi:hypothetical protein
MKRPPLLMHVRFRNEQKDTDFGLWLPLFLLLPLALVVLIILSPLILIALLVLWPSGWSGWALRVLGTAFPVYCSMRGLKVDIENRQNYVYVSVV